MANAERGVGDREYNMVVYGRVWHTVYYG